jgi:hypothetical protein
MVGGKLSAVDAPMAKPPGILDRSEVSVAIKNDRRQFTIGVIARLAKGTPDRNRRIVWWRRHVVQQRIRH